MPDMFIYSTPPQAVVTLTLDSGAVITGQATTANGRSDAHRLTIPSGTPGQGATLNVSCDGHTPFEGRGVLATPAAGDVRLILDDIRLVKAAPVQQPKPATATQPQTAASGPTPTTSKDPQAIINAIFASGAHSLATKEGCGRFTEACCAALHEVDPMWGHIKKSGAQNQFNGHAVDAIQLLTGETRGIYDIIFDSESPNAKPSFNRKGDPDGVLWFFPAASL
jgi:hypothetical protein